MPTIPGKKAIMYLDIANRYAETMTGCSKVSVGSVIVRNYTKVNENIVSVGANRAIPDLCMTSRGCQRIELYGTDSKFHRLPGDCRALHSEIDAISKAGQDLSDCDIFVTRYPCEACARAIVASGIKRVWYGREQQISLQTQQIFAGAGVESYWLKDWTEEDRND